MISGVCVLGGGGGGVLYREFNRFATIVGKIILPSYYTT